MKRVILIAIMIFGALVFAGCGDSDDTVVISERFFAQEMQEVVFNHNQYLGRTIHLEGMFRTIPWEGIDRFLVMRYVEGCCGPEPFGFEVVLGDFSPFSHDAWVEVTGILAMVDGFLVLEVSAINELEVRGLELV